MNGEQRTMTDKLADYPTAVVPPTIACAECAERIPLALFATEQGLATVRTARCPGCRRTTSIHLIQLPSSS